MPHKSNEVLFKVEGLKVRFGNFIAVNRISFEIKRGEIFGFLGPNGAGKTTSLKVFTGQLIPTEGGLELAGHNLLTEFSKLKPKFGYVPDFDNHFEDFTAEQNLKLFCGLYNTPLSRIDEVLDQVSLRKERHIPIRNFSAGMKRKLTLAREILHSPALLYLDEPTANLDVHSKQQVRQALKARREEGASTLITTHDMDEAEALCDRIAILHKGNLLEINTPFGFKEKYRENTIQAIVGKEQSLKEQIFHLDQEEDRETLSNLFQSNSIREIRSKEFKFKDAFLKLTGDHYL